MSDDGHSRASDLGLTFLQGGGEMGARMRATDWSQSPLGPPSLWPLSLKTCVRIILTSRQPMFVWWGEQLINLYNDAYKSIVGGKHPDAFGQPAALVWREIWGEIGPRAAQAMSGDEGTYDEALLLIMERHGYQEETYYTFSYSPVPNDLGGAGGIICANTDDTSRIIGERRVLLLRDLAARTAESRTLAEACEKSAVSLATSSRDLPFAALFLLDVEHERVELAATSGIEAGHVATPREARLEEGYRPNAWPFAAALRTHEMVLVEDLAPFGELPNGGWPRPPSRAVVVPLTASGATGRTGFLVVGLSPFRQFDEDYKGFLLLVSGQISASLANAQAYEVEKRRAEELAELDRAKTVFFSNVSHEFRTPLTLMLGPTEDALAMETPALTGESLRAVHRNELRLLKLVNALLDFSRLEAGREKAAFEPTDLAGLTRDIASAFRSAIERAGLRFDVDCEPLSEDVFVDHDMWEKIVLNLLSNAVKFTFDGAIRVRLAIETIASGDRAAVLRVSDTGTGVSADELPNLFRRFYRVQGARSRAHEGSGIGLALVAELVRIHGGEIDVESRVGVGTSFRVTVPLGRSHLPDDRVDARAKTQGSTNARAYVEEALRWLPDPNAPSENDAGTRDGRDESTRDESPSSRRGDHDAPMSRPTLRTDISNARIILADDNADMRDYVGRLLRARWQIEAYPDGQAALAAIEKRPPDLVLTDVMMPHLDGFGLLRELRSREATRSIPVIMLSARAGEESRVEGLEAGADDYLPKPFSARELLARVTTHLQIVQSRQRIERLREVAEAASRAKDEFLSTLSHELRTPLNAIVGWSNLLRAGSVPADRVDRAIETIERNARVQARLIEELLDLSRIEQGKLVLSVGPVEMVRVVEAAIEAVRPACDAKGVRLQPVLDSHATIVGDPDRLQQIVWNLLSNAIKFTPKDGRVQIALHRAQSYVEVTVSDNGEGIAPSFMPHVFDRFRQGDPSTVRRAGGLGLGLAIVRSLVELHGGTVTADSPGVGLGATFTVRLPTAPLRADSGTPKPVKHPDIPEARRFECPKSLDGIRVLVVDDEPQTRELLRFVLEQCKVIVLTAASATEALDLMDVEPVDMLVSDIGMPVEDGYTLVQRVRERPAERGGRIPALALTAYARGEDRTRALRAGFDMHMTKPIEPAELIVIVESLVTRHRVAKR